MFRHVLCGPGFFDMWLSVFADVGVMIRRASTPS